MVRISQVQASNAALDDTTVPRVSVFVGATSGVGSFALAELLTSAKGHGAMKVYVVGRGSKQERQATLLDPLQALNPEAELIWVQGDVALLADVKRICGAIKRDELSLNLLYLSAGFVPWDENHSKLSSRSYVTT
jgi:NADP-dependent 3-hydroxy acid dehydrogenase YdfG